MPKLGGFLGKLADQVSSELFENDTTPTNKPVTAAVAPMAPPVISGTSPYTFGTLSTPTVGQGPVVIDDSIVAAVNDGVFGGGSPSHYVQFMKVNEAMGRPADPTVVLKAVQAFDSSITAAAILSDINTHMSKLEQVAIKANGDFDAAAKERLGGADDAMSQLQKQNDAAAIEIARHQSETATRMAQLADLSQKRQQDQNAISQAKAGTEAAEAAVKQTLTSMQAMFSSLAASAAS
jgi:hypothetical protein